jgi:hypothetical protein
MNPLVRTSGTLTFSEGNLKNTFVSAWTIGLGTIALPTSGKFYWESTIVSGGNNLMFGLYNPTQNTAAASAYTHTGGAIFYFGNGNKYINGVASAYGATFTTGDTIGVAVNLDANTITFYKNNVSQGAISFAANMIGIPLSPAFLGISSSAVVNFGQRPFTYTPPAGYLKLNTFNLPDSSIVDGSTNFNTVLYTGNGTSQSITGVNFQPDFTWIKQRSSTEWHILSDVIRGTDKQLFSNSTNAEQTNSTFLTSYNTDGFTVGTSTGTNGSGSTYVAWNWKAGGTAVSNTAGTITSSVSANPTAGFSVVTYTGNGTTGASIGHGLGVAPRFIITKSRSNVLSWLVYHASAGASTPLVLNSTAAASAADYFNSQTPTSSVFYIGSSANGSNITSATYVAYCFAGVEGYSKFGSYTGNGSADGPFVYTGFRPAYVMVKRSAGGTGHWNLFDTARNTYNVSSTRLYPDLSGAEDNNLTTVDILSNGFKFRDTNAQWNASGSTYIYMAFAENPFKNSLAR